MLNRPLVQLMCQCSKPNDVKTTSVLLEMIIHYDIIIIAVDCLEYKPDDRPTAPELCNKMEKLKKEVRYSQSVTSNQVSASNSEQQAVQNHSDNSIQKDDLKSYQETIESMKSDLQDKQWHNESMEDKIRSLEKQYHESQATIKSLTSNLQEKQNHIVSVEGSYKTKLDQLEQQMSLTKDQHEYIEETLRSNLQKKQSHIESIEGEIIQLNQLELQNEHLKQKIEFMQIDQFGTLQWREESIAWCYNFYEGTSILVGNHIYFIAKDVSYVYDTVRKVWNTNFTCPTYDCGVGLVYGHLTIFGGKYRSGYQTSKDIHWYCDQKWMKLPNCLPHEITINHAVALTSKYIITIADSIYIHAKYATHNDFRPESWHRVHLKICPDVEDIIICKNMMYMRDKSSVTKWWKCLIKHFDDGHFER